MEVWKPCVGYEGLYEVSDLGNVRSLDRPIYKRDGTFRYMKKSQVMKKEEMKLGYLRVTLSNFGTVKKVFIHRLVAEAFLGVVDSKLVVNHIDGIKTNNCVDNLEWVTVSENNMHKLHVLGTHENHFLFDKEFRMKVASEYIYGSSMSGLVGLANKYGVGKETIRNWVKEFK